MLRNGRRIGAPWSFCAEPTRESRVAIHNVQEPHPKPSGDRLIGEPLPGNGGFTEIATGKPAPSGFGRNGGGERVRARWQLQGVVAL